MSATNLPQTPQNIITQNQTPTTATQGHVLEPFIDKPEVARRLNKEIRTIDNWMQRGLIPYYKISRSVSFKRSEVEASLRARCRVNGSGLNDK